MGFCVNFQIKLGVQNCPLRVQKENQTPQLVSKKQSQTPLWVSTEVNQTPLWVSKRTTRHPSGCLQKTTRHPSGCPKGLSDTPLGYRRRQPLWLKSAPCYTTPLTFHTTFLDDHQTVALLHHYTSCIEIRIQSAGRLLTIEVYFCFCFCFVFHITMRISEGMVKKLSKEASFLRANRMGDRPKNFKTVYTCSILT